MHEEQAKLVGCRGPKAGGLPCDVVRREHDVTQLAGLAVSEVRVVRPLALERDDVRGAISAAPLGVELAHAIVPHDGDGHQAVAGHALLGKHAVEVGANLLLGDGGAHTLLCRDVILVRHDRLPFRAPWRRPAQPRGRMRQQCALPGRFSRCHCGRGPRTRCRRCRRGPRAPGPGHRVPQGRAAWRHP